MYKLETYYNVFPWHVNHFGSLHGGIYMSWLIDSGGLLMSSISKGNYLLASLDYLYLFKPARVGDIIRVISEVTATWNSSAEIKVKACIKDKLGAIGLMTFTAVDENNRPRPLPTSVGADEEANRRKEERLKRKARDLEDKGDMSFLSFWRSYIRTIYPEHGFTNGILYAGKMYMMLDEALAIIAKLYSKGNVYTVSAGYANFLTPVKIGDILEIQGGIEYTGNTSIDVGAKVFSINHYTGERKLVSRTVFSFVAIDENGKPKPIPKIVPSSEIEKKIFEERAMEREVRIKIAKNLQETEECDER